MMYRDLQPFGVCMSVGTPTKAWKFGATTFYGTEDYPLSGYDDESHLDWDGFCEEKGWMPLAKGDGAANFDGELRGNGTFDYDIYKEIKGARYLVDVILGDKYFESIIVDDFPRLLALLKIFNDANLASVIANFTEEINSELDVNRVVVDEDFICDDCKQQHR